jgi:hypothetical protein
MRQGLTSLATTVAILTTAVRAEAKDNNAFYELEPKYIFAFTIGSSIEIEGEKAFEPDTVANFGKRDGSYTATETKLECESNRTSSCRLSLGPRFPTAILTTSLTLMTAVWELEWIRGRLQISGPRPWAFAGCGYAVGRT